MSSATGSAAPRLWSTVGAMLSPPVVLSMRSVSSASDSFSVPISVSESQKKGRRGSRRAGTRCRGSARSAYSTLDVKRSCVSSVAPPAADETSVGTAVAACGMSESWSEGMLASASGESGASWRALSSCSMRYCCVDGHACKRRPEQMSSGRTTATAFCGASGRLSDPWQ
jgi:hypothetical protein